jgi:hypothetical protein
MIKSLAYPDGEWQCLASRSVVSRWSGRSIRKHILESDILEAVIWRRTEFVYGTGLLPVFLSDGAKSSLNEESNSIH